MAAEYNAQDLLLDGPNRPSTGGNEAAEGAKPKGLDFSPFIRTAQRNFLLIGGVTAVVGGMSIASNSNTPQVYQGRFSILVEPITSQGRSTDPSAISRAQSLERDNVDYPTLLQVLQSPEIIGKIAKQIQTRYKDVTTETLTRDLLRKNLVIQRNGTNLLDSARVLDVSYQGVDPQRVEFILQELAKGYLRYSLEDRRNRIGGGVEFIEDQLPALQQRVNTLEAQLQALKQRNNLIDPKLEGDAISKQQQDIRAQRLLTERELAEQQSLRNRLQSQIDTLTPANLNLNEALASVSLSENTRYQELLGQLKKLEAEKALKEARLGPASPVMQSLNAQIQQLKELIDSEAGRNISTQFDPSKFKEFQGPTELALIKQLTETSNAVQLLQVRQEAIRETEAYLDQKLQQFPVIARQYNDLEQQLEISTKTLNQFLSQRETLRIEAAQKEVPWEIIAAPKLATDTKGVPVPVAGDASKKSMMGIVAGVFLGFAASLLKERLKNVFYSSADVRSAVPSALLGNIPTKQGLGQLVSPLSATGDDPFSKAFGTLYTNLRFLSKTPVSSLVTSSAGSGDGTTTVAMNLALAAASMGQKVLLVDANLRSPSIHESLGLPSPQRGLSDILVGKTALEEVLHTTALERNLAVLPAGHITPDSPRLLASAEMKALMVRLHANYDLVIYDAPNLGEYADANFLAAQTAGLLMVVGVKQTKKPALKRVVAELTRFKQPIIGVVTNEISKKRRSASGNPYLQYEQQSVPSNSSGILQNLNVLNSGSSNSVK